MPIKSHIIRVGVPIRERTTLSFVLVLNEIVEELVIVQQVVVATVVLAIESARPMLAVEVVDRLDCGKTLGTNRLKAPESSGVVANLDTAQTSEILVPLESLDDMPLTVEHNNALNFGKFILGNLIEKHSIVGWKQLTIHCETF